MDNFDDIFKHYALTSVSYKVKAFLKNVYHAVLNDPINIEELNTTLLELFVYLDSGEGKTKDNYWTVDLFLSDHDKLWRPALTTLPDKYQKIFTELEFFHGAAEEPKLHTNAKHIIDLLNYLN